MSIKWKESVGWKAPVLWQRPMNQETETPAQRYLRERDEKRSK